jgi:hypothetical protein
MSTDGKRLVALAAGSLAAFGLSGWLYQSLIVPRLPEIPSVPLWWWVATYLPVILIIAAAGIAATSLSKVPLYSSSVFVPPMVVEVTRGLVTDAPVMHDVWVQDWGYWGIQLIQFAACTAGVGLAYAAGHVRLRRWLGA